MRTKAVTNQMHPELDEFLSLPWVNQTELAGEYFPRLPRANAKRRLYYFKTEGLEPHELDRIIDIVQNWAQQIDKFITTAKPEIAEARKAEAITKQRIKAYVNEFASSDPAAGSFHGGKQAMARAIQKIIKEGAL